MNEVSRFAYEIAARDASWKVLPVLAADTTTGEILFLSEFVASIFGYAPEELLGKPVEALISETLRSSHSLWRQDASAPRTRLMGVGRQVMGLRKNGQLFPAHIGLTVTTALDREIGIAFVIDLTGVVASSREAGPSITQDTEIEGEDVICRPPSNAKETFMEHALQARAHLDDTMVNELIQKYGPLLAELIFKWLIAKLRSNPSLELTRKASSTTSDALRRWLANVLRSNEDEILAFVHSELKTLFEEGIKLLEG